MLKVLMHLIIVLFFTNIYATNMKYAGVTNFLETRNNRLDSAALFSDSTIHFEAVIDSAIEYLKIKNIDSATLDNFCKNKAYCTTLLWAYINFLKNKQNQADYHNLLDKLNNILAWNKQVGFLSADLAVIFTEILTNINYIDKMLRPDHQILNLDKLFKDQPAIKLFRDYSLASPFSLQQLTTLLQENIFKNKLVYIVSPFHVTAIYKSNDGYCCFDAHNLEHSGKKLKDIHKVGEVIFEAHNFFHTQVIALGFVILSTEVANEDTAILGAKINNYLNTAELRSHDDLYQRDAIELSKKISCISSYKILKGHAREAVVPVVDIKQPSHALETIAPIVSINKQPPCIREVIAAIVGTKKPPRIKEEDGDMDCKILENVILQGDVKTLKFLITNGKLNPKQRINGKTLLMVAVEKDYFDMASVLINDGKVSVDELIVDGKTALMYASQYGNLRMVRLLLQAKANRDLADDSGDTPLMFATVNNHAQITLELLGRGENICLKDNNAALDEFFDAIKKGNLNNVKNLLDGNYGLIYKNKDGWDGLMYAAKNKNYAMLDMLLQRKKYTKDTRENQKYLMIAAAVGDANLIKSILAGAEKQDLEHTYLYGLMLAAAGGHLDVVKILSAKNPPYPQFFGWNVFMHAAKNKHIVLIKALLSGQESDSKNQDAWIDIMIAAANHDSSSVLKLIKRVNIETQDKYRIIVLLIAATSGDIDTLKLFFDKKFIGGRFNAGGNTLLMHAVYGDNADIVHMLLENGARLDDKTSSGKTALLVAASTGNKKIIEDLLSHGANLQDRDENNENVVFWATLNSNIVAAEIFLKKGAYVDEANKNGLTPFILASQFGDYKMVELLLNYGAHINKTSHKNWSALITAVNNRNYTLVRYFLDKNAYLDQQTKDGWTALMCAVLLNDFEIVQALLEKRANIYLKNNDGQDALMIASKDKYSPVYKALMDHIEEGNSE